MDKEEYKIFIKNLSFSYEDFEMQINELKISGNQRVFLLGKNGSGKSTLLRIISDLHLIDKNSVLLFGKDNAHSGCWKSRTSVYIDENFLIPFYTPKEYWNYLVKIRKEQNNYLTEFLNANFLDAKDLYYSSKRIATLSSGNKKKCGLIGALLFKIELLILDEPWAHLDPKASDDLDSFILNQTDSMLLLVSNHDVEKSISLGDRILILSDGRISQDLVVEKNLKSSDLVIS